MVSVARAALMRFSLPGSATAASILSISMASQVSKRFPVLKRTLGMFRAVSASCIRRASSLVRTSTAMSLSLTALSPNRAFPFLPSNMSLEISLATISGMILRAKSFVSASPGVPRFSSPANQNTKGGTFSSPIVKARRDFPGAETDGWKGMSA